MGRNHLSEDQKYILDLCRKANGNNPVTRKQLKDALHRHDTDIRQDIGALRDMGFRIINNRNGYWLATPKEYKEWLPLYLSYANTIYRRKKAMDEYNPRQLRMELR